MTYCRNGFLEELYKNRMNFAGKTGTLRTMGIKLLILDFDGLIVDSFKLLYELTRMQLPGLTEDECRALSDGNINESRSQYHKQAVTFDYWDAYARQIMELQPVVGMSALIHQLAQDGRLVIVSSTESGVIRTWLASHGLLGCFAEILGNDIATSKVEKFQMLKKIYDLPDSHYLFITDTLGDIREAAQANIATIGVGWGFHPAEHLMLGKPLAIATGPDELAHRIQQWKNGQLVPTVV